MAEPGVSGEELEAIITKAVRDSIQKELGSYKVDKEQHYLDHAFLTEFRKWYDGLKNSFWKSIVTVFVMALFALLLAGFIVWGKGNFK